MVSRINMIAVSVVMIFRLTIFHFTNALVIRQCCQMWTSINAYHAILITQWSDPHESAEWREERMDRNNPTSNSKSTTAFEIGFNKIRFIVLRLRF